MKTLMALIFSAFLSAAVLAGPLEGRKTISLVDRDGVATDVGEIEFSPAPGGSSFKIEMDRVLLKDHFISMKELKCLEGPTELACHIPYPYKNPSIVSARNLAWLEHALLFLKKDRKEFGANLWNGMLYKMAVDGDEIVGELRDIDLNYIASPPEDLTVPPYMEDQQGEAELTKRWLPRLRIH